jgi:hypothetical protein
MSWLFMFGFVKYRQDFNFIIIFKLLFTMYIYMHDFLKGKQAIHCLLKSHSIYSTGSDGLSINYLIYIYIYTYIYKKIYNMQKDQKETPVQGIEPWAPRN